MKNHKGAIATLLTLGLVVIGTLITLGTSLFVSNNQNNLSLNSKAAESCTHRYSDGCNGRKSTSCEKHGNFLYICIPTASSNTPVPTQGGGGGGTGGGVDCGMVLQEAKAECGSNSGDYTKVGCLKVDGKQTYKCNSNIDPTQPPTGGGGGGGDEDYPDDDSCWIVKCIDGKAKKMTPAYTTSLSQYDMPLSSCPDGSPYSGGGWTVIGSDNADAKAKTFDCQNGNDEITLAPTKTPTPTNPQGGDIKLAGETCGYEDDCVTSYTCIADSTGSIRPHTGGKCKKYTPPVTTKTPTPTPTTASVIPKESDSVKNGCFGRTTLACLGNGMHWQQYSTSDGGTVMLCCPDVKGQIESFPTGVTCKHAAYGDGNCTDGKKLFQCQDNFFSQKTFYCY